MRGHHRYNIRANKKEQSSWVNFGVNLVFWFRLLLFGSAFVLMLCFVVSSQLFESVCLCPEAEGKKQLVTKRFDKAPCLVRTMRRLCTKHDPCSPQYHWEQTVMSALSDDHTMYQ